MEVKDICKKLKPIIGGEADRYWLAYLSEDYRGKQELEMALQMLAARMLGSDVSIPEVHLSAPSNDVASGPYPLGRVIYSKKALHSFGLREDEWIQHTAVFGRSGAGKTNTAFIIIENFLDRRKPFLIFDWKRNYRDLLSVRNDEILVYTVGRQTVPFVFNPLIPPDGTDPMIWLKKLIEIIAHSYYLGEGVMFLLQEALNAVYKEAGVYDGKVTQYPTFDDVYRWILEHPVKGRQALWMDSTMRAVKSICFGHMGNVVNTSVQPNLASLLEKNVILELDGLTNADKNLIIESMLLWIHHYRLSQPARETFKHAIIIEEAHHILLKKIGGRGGEAITDTILREIRELGEAIVLVDQHPSLISIPALGNTYTTIAMNLKHRSDINAVGASMLLEDEERDLLGRLPIGTAVVKLQGRWLEPFVIEIPHKKIKKGAIDDTALIQLMTEKNIICPYDETTEIDSIESKIDIIELSKTEERFLKDVFEHPLVGTVERYRNLGLSRRKGNTIRETCIRKDLIVPITIPTRSGRTVLTELTAGGRQTLRDLGLEVPGKSRWGSLEHEFWKEKVAEKLTGDGWNVTIEEPVNGHTDVTAENRGQKIAVEIETGKSDWLANVKKNLANPFDKIFVVVTNTESFRKIVAESMDIPLESNVQIIEAQDFLDQANSSILGFQ